jgi:hypothetical protein
LTTKRTDRDLPAPLEGIAEEPITRARAIKLAGALVGTGAFALFLPDEADARRRPRRPRRRRRKARVADSSSTPITLNVAPGGGGVLNPSIDITNPAREPLTIRNVKVIDSDGDVIGTAPLVGGPVTIGRGETATITPDLSGLTVTELLDADGLRLIDGRRLPITVIDENGVQVGDIPLDVDALVDAL